MKVPEPVLTADTQHALTTSVLRVLAYFDVFKHPLTAQEVFEGCDHPSTSLAHVAEALTALRRQGGIRQEGDYYALDAGSSVAERLASGVRCAQYLRQAHRYSRLIARFPFVRGVCLSGSVSKGRADAGADIDYFIVAAPGRLWVCRTLLILFKKTVLLNRHRYFCLNYFVDADHLAIPDRNRFTATEIAFLIPTYDYACYAAFRAANPWVSHYFPNKPLLPAEAVFERGDTWLKRGAEALLAGRVGAWLEKRCLALTRAYRRAKFRQLAADAYEHAMRATPEVAKHHPNSFQGRVLAAYAHTLRALEARLGADLGAELSTDLDAESPADPSAVRPVAALLVPR